MVSVVIRDPDEFEATVRNYLFESFEEARSVRVGEKEISEQAAIVARFADLFSRAQLEALARAEREAAGRDGSPDELERLYRLRKTCEGGIVQAELAAREDALENEILAARVVWRGEELPLRAAQARLAMLDAYGDRDELGELAGDESARFNDGRLELVRAGEELESELSGEADPIARSEEEKGISLRELERVLSSLSQSLDEAWGKLREHWFGRLLGPEREEPPRSYHSAYMRRLSPLAHTYTRERAGEVCLDTLEQLGFRLGDEPNIRLDLDDRSQKDPRACVIASDPPRVVHLITRAQGGLHDYEAFLHEAGHALHYAGCDPSLPYAFRALSRDHALTEIYSYLCAKVVNEPGWHERYFSLSPEEARENAEAGRFLELLLFRRYVAKLSFELGFWRRFREDGGSGAGYAEGLERAVGLRYRPDGYLTDMDPGFYSADYLRAWVRSAQLRAALIAEVGEGWWRSPHTGEVLRSLFREGTRPLSEDVARRLGFDPLDTGPLADELSGTA
jgi:hypothetical protein